MNHARFEWIRDDRTAGLGPDEIQHPEQTLDLWRGIITSRYQLGGVPVTVVTTCDPGADRIAVRIESELLASPRLRVNLAVPHGHDLAVKLTPPLDWSRPEAHRTVITRRTGRRVDLQRTIDATTYHVAVAWAGQVLCTPEERAEHSRAVDAIRTLIPGAFTERDPTPDRSFVFRVELTEFSGREATTR